MTRLVERHEVLRSRITVGPDGAPMQEVPGTARMTVAIEATPADQLAAAQQELYQRMQSQPFRFPHDWPVRFALLTVDEQPGSVVMVFSHTAVDGAAVRLLNDELRDLLHRGPDAALPAVTTQPLDRVMFERSAAGRKLSAQSLAWMERQVRAAPQTMFAIPPRTPDRPRFKRMELRSSALLEATRRIAVLQDVSTSSVLLAGTAVMLSVLTGNRSVLLKTVLGNRGFPGLRDLVGVTLSNGLVLLDVAEGSFADAVRSAANAGLQILLRSQSDPVELARMLDRVNDELGIAVDLSAFFNDFRVPAEEPKPTDVDLGLLARQTTTSWVGEWNRQDAKFFFHAAPGEGCDRVYLMVDTAFIPSAWVTPLLLGLERLMIEAAAGDLALAGVARLFAPVIAPVRNRSWRLVGGNWVELPEVRRVVLAAAALEAAAVFPDPDGTFTAFVATDDGSVTPRGLHRAVVRALREYPTAVAPTRYIVCPSAPQDPDDRTAWEQMPVRRAGSGWDHAQPAGDGGCLRRIDQC